MNFSEWKWRVFFAFAILVFAYLVAGLVFFRDDQNPDRVFFAVNLYLFLLAYGVINLLSGPIKKALDSPAVRWIARQAEWIARAGTALWFSATAILIWLKVFSRDSIPSDGYFVLGGGLAAIWAGCAVLRRWQTRPTCCSGRAGSWLGRRWR